MFLFGCIFFFFKFSSWFFLLRSRFSVVCVFCIFVSYDFSFNGLQWILSIIHLTAIFMSLCRFSYLFAFNKTARLHIVIFSLLLFMYFSVTSSIQLKKQLVITVYSFTILSFFSSPETSQNQIDDFNGFTSATERRRFLIKSNPIQCDLFWKSTKSRWSVSDIKIDRFLPLFCGYEKKNKTQNTRPDKLVQIVFSQLFYPTITSRHMCVQCPYALCVV